MRCGASEGLPKLSEIEMPIDRETELERMSERESSVASGVSRMSETTGSTVDYLRGGLDSSLILLLSASILISRSCIDCISVSNMLIITLGFGLDFALRQQEKEEMLE